MANQHWHRPDAFRSAADQGNLSPTHRVNAIRHWIEADGGYPGLNEALVLARGKVVGDANPTRKQEPLTSESSLFYPSLHGQSRLRGDLEL